MGRVRDLTPAEEHLVGWFSGRVTGAIGRFAGRPERDRWVWDDAAAAMLGRPVNERVTGLDVLVAQVQPTEQGLLTDAISEAGLGAPFAVSCRLTAPRGSSARC